MWSWPATDDVNTQTWNMRSSVVAHRMCNAAKTSEIKKKKKSRVLLQRFRFIYNSLWEYDETTQNLKVTFRVINRRGKIEVTSYIYNGMTLITCELWPNQGRCFFPLSQSMRELGKASQSRILTLSNSQVSRTFCIWMWQEIYYFINCQPAQHLSPFTPII